MSDKKLLEINRKTEYNNGNTIRVTGLAWSCIKGLINN